MKKRFAVLVGFSMLAAFWGCSFAQQGVPANPGGKNITDSIEAERDSARAKACIANMKVIEGACEIYGMEAPSVKDVTFKKLLDGKYLKAVPQCPAAADKEYQIIVSGPDNALKVDVKCVKHGSLNSIPVPVADLNLSLIKCSMANMKEDIEKYINDGADVNCSTANGSTPLHYAAFNGNLETARFLIGKGAGVNVKTKDGITPLHYAVSKNSKEIVRLLIEKGAEVNAKDSKGKVPADFTQNAEIKDILSGKITGAAKAPDAVKKTEQTRKTPVAPKPEATPNDSAASGELNLKFNRALQEKRVDEIKNLLAQGADINVRGTYGETALHTSATRNEMEIAQILIECGADLNATDKKGCTPLHYALLKGSNDVAKLLIEKGADVNAKQEDEFTPLSMAEFKKNKELVDILKAAGAQ